METMPVGTTEWDIEDYLESIKARLSPLKRFGDDLLKAATHVHKALWPEDPSPRTVKVLAERLSEGRNRLRAWRESAARAGAEEALMWVLSWFEDLDLEKLAALRDGSPWIDDPELVKKRQAIAYEMAQYALPTFGFRIRTHELRTKPKMRTPRVKKAKTKARMLMPAKNPRVILTMWRRTSTLTALLGHLRHPISRRALPLLGSDPVYL